MKQGSPGRRGVSYAPLGGWRAGWSPQSQPEAPSSEEGGGGFQRGADGWVKGGEKIGRGEYWFFSAPGGAAHGEGGRHSGLQRKDLEREWQEKKKARSVWGLTGTG